MPPASRTVSARGNLAVVTLRALKRTCQEKSGRVVRRSLFGKVLAPVGGQQFKCNGTSTADWRGLRRESKDTGNQGRLALRYRPAAEETQLSFSKRTQGLSPRYLQSLALRLKPHPDTNRSRWRVFHQPREAVHVQNGDAAPRLGRLRPSLARPDEAVTEPRTPLRGLGRLPALPGLTRLLKNCAVPTGVASNFPLYPALRLRLRARLRLFRAYGTGFRHFCPTVVRAPRVS